MKLTVTMICLIILNAIPAYAGAGKWHYYVGAGAPFYNTNELLSESVISLDKAVIYGLRSVDGKVETLTNPQLSAGYRLVRLLGVDFPVSLYAAEIPHEYLGHGFPAKNYGGNIDKVNIGFPPIPYDLKYSSSTTTSGENVPANIYAEWSNHKRANGLQVENSMSHLIKNKFWQATTADYDLSLLLLKTTYAPGWYALFNPPKAAEIGNVNATNDIAALAARYSNLSGKQYTASSIRNKSFLYNSLNPLVLWSWYGVFKYIVTGDSETELPYISIFNIKWMPGISYTLTGYGEEYVLSNYFLTEGGRSGSLEIAMGSVDNKYRTSIQVNNLLGESSSDFELGAELHHWKQRKTGSAAFIDLNYYPTESKSKGVHLKAGYKSFGYLRGYGIKAGAAISLGAVYRLD